MTEQVDTEDTDEGWIELGLCGGGCHVRVVVPVDGQVCVASYLSPERARVLAADILRLANEAEGHPENAGERRH